MCPGDRDCAGELQHGPTFRDGRPIQGLRRLRAQVLQVDDNSSLKIRHVSFFLTWRQVLSPCVVITSSFMIRCIDPLFLHGDKWILSSCIHGFLLFYA